MRDTLLPYEKILEKWLPGMRLARAGAPVPADALLRWRRGGKHVRYIVAHRKHLATQDVRVVVADLERIRATFPTRARVLVMAPHVRVEQGTVLQRHAIDYIDLAGNVHLDAPGTFVHVEGKRPAERQARARARLTMGWVRTVMALLIRPELAIGTYRPLAGAADVALGTVTTCLNDLQARGFLRETAKGRVFTNRADLVALWVPAYGEALRPKLHDRHFQMREGDMRARWGRLDEVLTARGVRWALTGADAAAIGADFLRAAETEIYVAAGAFEDREILTALPAQPALRSGNLRVLDPPGPLAFPAPDDERHPPRAPLLLAYAELRLRGTEQANEAADMILPQVLEDARA